MPDEPIDAQPPAPSTGAQEVEPMVPPKPMVPERDASDEGNAQATADIEAMLARKKPGVPTHRDPPSDDGGGDRRPGPPAAWPWLVLGVVLGMAALAGLTLWMRHRAPPA